MPSSALLMLLGLPGGLADGPLAAARGAYCRVGAGEEAVEALALRTCTQHGLGWARLHNSLHISAPLDSIIIRGVPGSMVLGQAACCCGGQ